MTEEDKKLLAKIDGKSLSIETTVKGSIYFYIDAHDADNPHKEQLIDDPSALDSAGNHLGIEIRNENKHHRWAGQMPQALKILEFATAYLKQKNKTTTGFSGINAELKWLDELGLENIIHLSLSKDNREWQAIILMLPSGSAFTSQMRWRNWFLRSGSFASANMSPPPFPPSWR